MLPARAVCCPRALYNVVHRMGDIMLRFIGGLAIGLAVGLYLGSIPQISERLSQLGEILSFSALATLL